MFFGGRRWDFEENLVRDSRALHTGGSESHAARNFAGVTPEISLASAPHILHLDHIAAKKWGGVGGNVDVLRGFPSHLCAELLNLSPDLLQNPNGGRRRTWSRRQVSMDRAGPVSCCGPCSETCRPDQVGGCRFFPWVRGTASRTPK